MKAAHLKNLTRTAVLTAMLAIAPLAQAQTQSGDASGGGGTGASTTGGQPGGAGNANTTSAREDDNRSNWGWLGLLGLIGLAGLTRRNGHDRLRDRDTTTTAARH